MDPLGIEWDEAACATRRAAGLSTLQADVASLVPGRVLAEGASLDGLIASPPCQAFSMAGKGEGRKALDAYRRAIMDTAHGAPVDRAALDDACGDPRGHLVLEPLRWTLALRPRWVALEQVEPVLPLWEAMGERLRALGYSVWAGVLSAERFGVPQTRRRAVLLASLDRPVGEPSATHRRYVAPRRNGAQTETLFDAPEPERIELPEEAHLEPWVSMAESLGWPTGARVQYRRGGERLEEEWSADRPSDTITSRVDRWRVVPASTAELQRADWPARRPATTIAGDPRVFQPGGHHAEGQQSHNAIRVTVEEAAALQSFPPGYPWQGSPGSVREQIGNAVPPLMALRALETVTGLRAE